MEGTEDAAEPLLNDPVATQAGPPRDLIVGLVGAVGTDLPWVVQELRRHLTSLGFAAEELSLSGLMRREYEDGALPERESVPYDEYVDAYMSGGNALRARWALPEALALVAVEEIRRRREARPDDGRPFAAILRSLKRPEEIRLLREVYRGQFVLIGCHAPRETRIRQLSDVIARTRGASVAAPHRARAEQLADRDEHELGPPSADPQTRRWLKQNGQSVEGTFPLADAYINLQHTSRAAHALRRFCDLLLGSPFISPSMDEHAMFHAGSAAVRSSDMSRQVGASIASTDGRVLAVGCNDVPRAGGGTYWEGDAVDARDFRLGIDANQDYRNRALREVFDVLKARGLLTDDALAGGAARFAEALDDTRVDGLIEFNRSAHAEMVALLDAAQRGVSVDGAVLYTSTFPCHNCAKHLVAAGISRVVFIEPYPKSLAEQLHGDAIAVDDPRRGGKIVHFEHFDGVAPMNYLALFERSGKRKKPDGTPVDFVPTAKSHKLFETFHHTPLVYEEAAIERLRKLRERHPALARELIDAARDAHVSATTSPPADEPAAGGDGPG